MNLEVMRELPIEMDSHDIPPFPLFSRQNSKGTLGLPDKPYQSRFSLCSLKKDVGILGFIDSCCHLILFGSLVGIQREVIGLNLTEERLRDGFVGRKRVPVNSMSVHVEEL